MLRQSSRGQYQGERHCLLGVGLGTCRCPTLLAEIFIEIPGREHEQQSLPRWSRHSAGWTIEQRGVQRSELIRRL